MAHPSVFVVFSDDWGIHPSSSQHLFRRIAKTNSVLWVNTIGMRNPRLTLFDLKKAVFKVERMFTRQKSAANENEPDPGVRVCQPFMLPYSGLGPIRSVNRRLVGIQLKRFLKKEHADNPIVVSTVPNACDFIAELHPSRIVYYCVDDFSQWPGLNHAQVKAMEAELIEMADVVLATSKRLFERLALAGKRPLMFSHGVDVDLFSQVAESEYPDIRATRRPRAGYFGLIDERIDLPLILKIIRGSPEVTYIFAGPIGSDVSCLLAERNVLFVGPIPYSSLPTLVASLDVLFLPYRVDEFTATISPLKLKEYLATGKPIVSTPIEEAKMLGDYIYIASSAEEWDAALTQALVGRSTKRDSHILLAGQSWDEKAGEFIDLVGA